MENSTVLGHRKGSGIDNNPSVYVWARWGVPSVGGCVVVWSWCCVAGVGILRLIVMWDCELSRYHAVGRGAD